MKHFAKLAGINELLDVIDRSIETVAHTDVEHLAAFVLRLLHLQRFCIGSCGRLFAQNMLSGTQQITGDGGVREIGGADGDGLYLRIVQNHMIIRDRGAAAVFFDGLRCALRNDVAEILDFCIWVFQVGGNVRDIGDRSAADDSNFH